VEPDDRPALEILSLDRERHEIPERFQGSARAVGQQREYGHARRDRHAGAERLPLTAPGEIRQQQPRENLQGGRESDPDAGARVAAIGQVGGGGDEQRQQDRFEVQMMEVVVNGEQHDGERDQGGTPPPAPAALVHAPGERHDAEHPPARLGEGQTRIGQGGERHDHEQRERRPPDPLCLWRVVQHQAIEDAVGLRDFGGDVVALDAERRDERVNGEGGDERRLLAPRHAAISARASQPPRRSSPPSGVTAPHQRAPVRASR
jgi:hypothetical protein